MVKNRREAKKINANTKPNRRNKKANETKNGMNSEKKLSHSNIKIDSKHNTHPRRNKKILWKLRMATWLFIKGLTDSVAWGKAKERWANEMQVSNAWIFAFTWEFSDTSRSRYIYACFLCFFSVAVHLHWVAFF